MTINLDQLEAKARAATPGQREITIDGRKLIVWKTGGTYQRIAHLDELPDGADLAFILDASPDVVIKLIEVAKAAEVLLGHLEHIGMTREEEPLMADLRTALAALEAP